MSRLLKTILFFSYLLSFSINSFGQKNNSSYQLLFQKHKIDLEENFNSLSNRPTISSDEIVEGKFFRLIQFYEIPNAHTKDELEKFGIKLLKYIPNKAYYVSIPAELEFEKIKDLPIRHFSKIKNTWKESQVVENRNFDEWAFDGKLIRLSVVYFNDVAKHYVEQKFIEQGIYIAKSSKYQPLLEIHIPIELVNRIAKFPFVYYVDQVGSEGTPEDENNFNLQRSNMLDSSNPMGRHYNGEGIKVLVRDDGGIGPHIDFQGRIKQNVISLGSHGDLVAGVVAGAGNLDPTKKGIASGVEIYTAPYVADFSNGVIDLHQNEGVLLTNSSFSDQCNLGYNINAATVDLQVFQNPTLMHIFSAGNSGNSDCNYGAGQGWGNITGGHKTGKNVIAVGNVDDNGQLIDSSSRGPSKDGRIKPDICANGQIQSTIPNNEYFNANGTSFSAPAVMGLMAQLYQAHQELKGSIPKSALIKALLLNTANDIENEGPDYKSGWGIANGFRAIKVLENDQYFNGSVSQNFTEIHNITIPNGVEKVKVMLHWTDPDATPGVAKTLVNDLDLVLYDFNGNGYLPWVLDTLSNAIALDAPAIKGEDRLNNMEQVTIDQPLAGDYSIEVSGYEVPFGTGDYYVVYEFITNDITVTFPNGGESLVPNQTSKIHWDANEVDTGFYTIEYSIDNGLTWDLIGNTNSTANVINWLVPNINSGTAKIRVSNGNIIDESDEDFSIAQVPTNLTIEKVCYNSILFSWTGTDAATSYEIFQLGEKYMESIGTTTDLEYEVSISNPTDEHWFAVQALGQNGMKSNRTIAIGYSGDVLDCITPIDLAAKAIVEPSNEFFIDCFEFEETVAFQIENRGTTMESNFEVSYQLDSELVVTETFTESIDTGTIEIFDFLTPISFSTSGTYDLKIWISNNNDLARYNDTIITTIQVNLNEPVTNNVFEDFESDVFPPTNWFIDNPDNNLTWEKIEVIGIDGDSTNAALVRNYDYNGVGQRDELVSFMVDLVDAESPSLSFDVSYRPYASSGLNDSLIIEVYNKCGQQYAGFIYNKTGFDLASVAEVYPFPWQPFDSEDWKRETVSLDNYINDTIIVKFINRSGFGNNLYIDNININQSPMVNVEEIATDFQVDLFPNPNDGNFQLKIKSEEVSDYQISVFDVNGKLIDNLSLKNNNGITFHQFDYERFNSGVYFLKIRNGSGVRILKMTVF